VTNSTPPATKNFLVLRLLVAVSNTCVHSNV
jgi:hypothetical protein